MRLALLLPLAALSGPVGCISLRNGQGVVPPPALCSHFKATVGCPRESISSGTSAPKTGYTNGSVLVKEWIWSGLSADVIDMAVQSAAQNGGLKKVYYADYEQTSYLGFVTVFNVVAYGE